MKLTRDEFRKLVKDKFFTVVFVKKDGTLRKMNARLDVSRYTVGGKNNVEHIPHYITVYDLVKKGYRTLNLDTIKEIHANGVVYK